MRGAPSSATATATTGRLQLGVTSLVAGYVLSDLLARYRRAHPAVEISAIEDNGDYLEHLLVGGKLDIAVMVTSNLRDRMALQSEILEVSAYRLWLPLGHPLAGAEIINVGDIAGEPLIMLTVDEIEENTGKLLNALGARPHVAFRTRSVEAVRSLVATGAGVALLPDLVYRPWSLEGDRIESPRYLGLAAGRPGRHGLAARLRPAAGGARLHRHRAGAAHGPAAARKSIDIGNSDIALLINEFAKAALSRHLSFQGSMPPLRERPLQMGESTMKSVPEILHGDCACAELLRPGCRAGC